MVATLDIAGRAVGPGSPCFIVAEAGVNHNGSVEQARRLVDLARRAGADAVKFQTWVTERLIAPRARMAPYQQRNLGREESQFEMAKRLELSQGDFREIKGYADQQGILFFSTPDEEVSADFLEQIETPVFKIGSGEVTNLPFLRHVALKKKPVILSTGMSTLSDVEAAVRTIEDAGNHQLILLHCVSDYPARPADCNLKAMETLRAAFQYPVGFSDHTAGLEVAVAAVALGACVLEKHVTLDKALPGPDHRMSLDADEFARLIEAVRTTEIALGTGRKWPVPAEAATKEVVQRSIVAARDLPAGKRLESDDLALRRAGGGLPPRYLTLMVGRTLRRPAAASEVIVLDMLG